ncbi:MAG: DEAD/DEAH box helicase family protein [Planctomycetota bacterium]
MDENTNSPPDPTADVCLEFDRGTLLCRRWPRAVELAGLPGMRWDPRVQSFRAPGRFHGPIVSALTDQGVAVVDVVRDPLAPPGLVRLPELRSYQSAALDAWSLAGHRGVVALPTGSGKTLVGIAAIARQRCPTLCLVPTRILVEQWSDVIGGALGVEAGRFGDGVREVRPITVATYESAYRHMHQLGNRFDLLIVDEVHHFGRGERDESLEMCVAPARLGLTATPPAPDGTNRLEQLVGPVVYALPIEDLTGTFLAEFDLVELRLDLTAEERRVHDALRDCFTSAWRRFCALVPSPEWSDFMRWAARTAPGREAIRAWHRCRSLLSLTRAKSETIGALLGAHCDSRSLVFTSTAEAAHRVAVDHLVMPITASIKKAERDAMLAAFRGGEVRALVSARVLNEGYDVPDADVGIVVGGSHGVREHTQRVGRLLRPRPGKRALVYELVTRGTAETAQAERRRHGLGPGRTWVL